MKRIHPLWSSERQVAYTEVALYVLSNGDNPKLSDIAVVSSLSRASIEWARDLPHGHDETFRDAFVDDLFKFDVVVHDNESNTHRLGDVGRLLVDTFFEEWTGLE